MVALRGNPSFVVPQQFAEVHACLVEHIDQVAEQSQNIVSGEEALVGCPAWI